MRIKVTAKVADGWDTDFYKHASVLAQHGLLGNKRAKHYTGIVEESVAQSIITNVLSWPAWSVEVIRVD